MLDGPGYGDNQRIQGWPTVRLNAVPGIVTAVCACLILFGCSASDVGTHIQDADELLAQDRFDEALVEYDEAIRIEPKNAPAYNNRGTAYGALGQYDRATDDFDESIRLDPVYAEAYNNRGIVSGKLGQYEKSVEDYGEAIRIEPLYALAYNNRGFAYRWWPGKCRP